MKKFMYYPLWRICELEDFLHKLELKGWRLNDIEFSFCFNFVKCEPKDSDYVITYDMAKDRLPCMYQYEENLLSNFSANKIPSKATGYSVFRVTGNKRNFNDLKCYRKKYIKHVIFQHILISLIFLIIGLFLVIASIHQELIGFRVIMVCVYLLIAISLFLYEIIGYVKQCKI